MSLPESTAKDANTRKLNAKLLSRIWRISRFDSRRHNSFTPSELFSFSFATQRSRSFVAATLG
jgi:hypothetical protein